MNDQGVDADHVAAPESGDTCTTPLRPEAAVERVPADQKPPSGGSVEVPDGAPQPAQTQDMADVTARAGRAPPPAVGGPGATDRQNRPTTPSNAVQVSLSSDEYATPGDNNQNMLPAAAQAADGAHRHGTPAAILRPADLPAGSGAPTVAPSTSAASARPPVNVMQREGGSRAAAGQQT